MSNKFRQKILLYKRAAQGLYPDKKDVHLFADELFHLLFGSGKLTEDEIAEKFIESRNILKTLAPQQSEIADLFFERLESTYDELVQDASAIESSDPAAGSVEEVMISYPGFFAIAIYRIARVLLELQVPYLPRMLTEHAHQATGIDIHPGAVIGRQFAIDHGTGIVIGETTVIGKGVRIYQGVTLGALSVDKNKKVPEKRHPTIEDDVIIYSGATILGGSTVIGKGSIIGGNVFLTSGVPPYSKVYQSNHIKIKNQGLITAPINFSI